MVETFVTSFRCTFMISLYIYIKYIDYSNIIINEFRKFLPD